MKTTDFIGGGYKEELDTKQSFILAQLQKLKDEQPKGKPDCPICEGTGTMYVPNGDDDVEGEECDCISGIRETLDKAIKVCEEVSLQAKDQVDLDLHNEKTLS
jgi:hypothetical protein